MAKPSAVTRAEVKLLAAYLVAQRRQGTDEQYASEIERAVHSLLRGEWREAVPAEKLLAP